MHFGICASADGAAVLNAPGLDFIEENVQGFLVPASDDAAFAAKRDTAAGCARPVRAANCFLPATLPCFGPTHDRARTRAWASTAFARARAVGIGTIVFGSGGARRRPDDLDEESARTAFSALAAELADLAAPHGVVLAVEPLNRGECNFINTLDDAADVIARAPRPNLGILADLFHMRRENEGPDAITRNGALIRHVHVAELATRSAPGIAGDDFRPWLAALKANGYDRTMSLECGWQDIAREAPIALATMRQQWADSAAG